MVEYNQCKWLIVGRSEHCGKRCIYDLCGIHRAQLRRKPGSEPHPCRRCGRVTKAESWLCRKQCGVDNAQKALHRAEARAKRLHPALMHELLRPTSVTQLNAPPDWRPGGRGFNTRRGRQHSFMEIDHEIFSTVILSLPLIQEGQLSVSGERMCAILVNHLEDYSLPSKGVVR